MVTSLLNRCESIKKKPCRRKTKQLTRTEVIQVFKGDSEACSDDPECSDIATTMEYVRTRGWWDGVDGPVVRRSRYTACPGIVQGRPQGGPA